MPDLQRIAFALALGTAGGLAFHAMHLPLPWMLGALFATMAAAVARAPVLGPDRMRPAVVAVIVALTVVPFYRFAGRLDWRTAYFAGMPGGLSEMIEIGEANGAKPAPIILAHSLRIVVTIALIALWFRVMHGLGTISAPLHPEASLTLVDAALLLACAVLGGMAGTRLHLPAPTFLGPLILSAVLHLSGLTDSTPPALLVNTAQVLLCTILGCRFRGISPGTLARAGLLSIGATLLTLVLALGAGLVMRAVAGVSIDQAMLALAPGGLTEMGLIAMAIQSDVAFVALHHVMPILFVLVLAPFAFRLLAARQTDP